jgi:hypothetical protein
MTYQSNRPERCGSFAAAVRSIEIGAQSALECYGDVPSLLRSALAEIAAQARQTLANDEAAQAADQEAFEQHLAAQYDRAAELERRAAAGDDQAEDALYEAAHECGTPPAGAPDLNTYPARMTVAQRDPADPESWVYRCAEQHPSGAPGWQSPDYADMGGALSGAADHARAMHDMALPADMAAALARAERDTIEMADAADQSRRESSACGQ